MAVKGLMNEQLNIVGVGAAFCMGCCPNIRNGTAIAAPAVWIEMHDEIFQFEIFKNFMKIRKYFIPFFEIFHETFNFQY